MGQGTTETLVEHMQAQQTDLDAWVNKALSSRGLRQTRARETVQDWALSTVYRIPASGGDLYLKEVPPIFGMEPSITAALWQLFPGRVPEPLVVGVEEGRMLMRDIGGEPLDFRALPDLQAVVLQLAQMQKTSMEHVDLLLRAGCLDRRPQTMPAALDEVLASARRLALFGSEEQQALERAAPVLRDMCRELARSSIRPTLVHGDLHVWNVRKRGVDIVLFDWTDASVSHPFFDLTVLLRARLPEAAEPYRHVLTDIYLDAWRNDHPDVDEVSALSEPLGALFQLVSYRRLVEAVGDHPDVESLRGMTKLWVRATVRLVAKVSG
jgi:Phosphotransferase enzyme family